MYRFRVVLRLLVCSAICSTCMDMHRNMLWVASSQHRHWGNLIAFRCFSTHQLQVTGECRWSTVIACGHSCSASLHQLSLRSCWMCNCLTRRCEDLWKVNVEKCRQTLWSLLPRTKGWTSSVSTDSGVESRSVLLVFLCTLWRWKSK